MLIPILIPKAADDQKSYMQVVGMKFIQESHELATLYGAAVKLQKLDEAVKTSAGADDHFLNVLITHMSRQLSSMRLGDQPNKQQ